MLTHRYDVSAPAAEPVTVADLKLHVRHSDTVGSAEDTYLSALIKAARQYAEAYCSRPFVPRTVEAWFDEFPATGHELELPWPDIQDVSVTYVDGDGLVAAMPSVDYTVRSSAYRSHLILGYAAAWPAPRRQHDAVRVRGNAGFPSNASPEGADGVPAPIKQAVLMIAGDLYENREAQVVGTIRTANPVADQMLHFYRYGVL